MYNCILLISKWRRNSLRASRPADKIVMATSDLFATATIGIRSIIQGPIVMQSMKKAFATLRFLRIKMVDL